MNGRLNWVGFSTRVFTGAFNQRGAASLEAGTKSALRLMRWPQTNLLVPNFHPARPGRKEPNIVMESITLLTAGQGARPRVHRSRPARHRMCGGTCETRSCQVPTGDLLEPGNRHESNRHDRADPSPDSSRGTRMCLVERNNAALQGGGGGFRTVLHTEFIQHVTDVELDRDLGDVQRSRELLVAETFCNHAENFQLPAGEGAVLSTGRQQWGDRRINVSPAPADLTDGSQQLLPDCAFQNVTTRSGLQ